MSAFTLENGRRLLLETADILDELGIRFFLIQGTALGAYRATLNHCRLIRLPYPRGISTTQLKECICGQ